MVNLLLEAANVSESWIDKNANTLTFWGVIIGILGIIATIIVYFLQKNASEKQVEEKSDEQKATVEKQIQVLAMEEQKMREEVKPQLAIEMNIQDRTARLVQLKISNSNRKGMARIIALNKISDGWILKKMPVKDITFTAPQILYLEYSVGKNPDEFEIVLEIEDLYQNKYKARIIPAMSTISLSDYE